VPVADRTPFCRGRHRPEFSWMPPTVVRQREPGGWGLRPNSPKQKLPLSLRQGEGVGG
jgi:hypothetical protein